MQPAIALPDVHLATARLTLRPPVEADLATIAEAIGEAAVSRMLARVPHPYCDADAAEWFASVGPRMEAGDDLQLSLVHDGRVIGGMGLRDLGAEAELGYWIARPHWGRGFATEAGHATLAFAFGVLGLARVNSGVFADNPASLRVQEKLGFERVGMRPMFCLARGETLDHIDTVLTRERHRAGTR